MLLSTVIFIAGSAARVHAFMVLSSGCSDGRFIERPYPASGGMSSPSLEVVKKLLELLVELHALDGRREGQGGPPGGPPVSY